VDRDLLQARIFEEFPPLILGLGNAIGYEQKAISRIQLAYATLSSIIS